MFFFTENPIFLAVHFFHVQYGTCCCTIPKADFPLTSTTERVCAHLSTSYEYVWALWAHRSQRTLNPGGLRPDRRARSLLIKGVRTWVLVRAVFVFLSVVPFSPFLADLPRGGYPKRLPGTCRDSLVARGGQVVPFSIIFGHLFGHLLAPLGSRWLPRAHPWPPPAHLLHHFGGPLEHK